MARDIIAKANSLIQASYRLSLTEMQILIYGTSLIDPFSKEFPLEYKIDIKNFATMFRKDMNSCYREIKKSILNKLWERDFSYEIGDEKVHKRRWLTDVVYGDKEGYIKLSFNPKIKPYLHQLTTKFTVYYIDQIAKFKSIYSIRFYEFSIMEINKSKKYKCKFLLSLNEIKSRLEIEEKYEKYSNFKSIVLEKAKNEINKFSDLFFDYKEIKNKRKVEKIEFSVKKKNEDNHISPDFFDIQEQNKNFIDSDEILNQQELTIMMQKNELRALMVSEYKITEHKADELLKEYSLERIEGAIRKIRFLSRRSSQKVDGVKNRAGYLVECIKNNWTKE